MKILNLEEFSKMPQGTIFQRCYLGWPSNTFGPLLILGEFLKNKDFYYYDILDPKFQRDGMFDAGANFLVLDKSDIQNLIQILQQ